MTTTKETGGRASRLRKLREGRDWTRFELAARADVHPSYVQMMEAGCLPTRGEALGRVAEALA